MWSCDVLQRSRDPSLLGRQLVVAVVVQGMGWVEPLDFLQVWPAAVAASSVRQQLVVSGTGPSHSASVRSSVGSGGSERGEEGRGKRRREETDKHIE